MTILQRLSADYSRSRIENLTCALMLAAVPVVVYARWDLVLAVLA